MIHHAALLPTYPKPFTKIKIKPWMHKITAALQNPLPQNCPIHIICISIRRATKATKNEDWIRAGVFIPENGFRVSHVQHHRSAMHRRRAVKMWQIQKGMNSEKKEKEEAVAELKIVLLWWPSLQLFSRGFARVPSVRKRKKRAPVGKSMKMRMLPGRRITRQARVIYGAPFIATDIQIFSRGIPRYKNILCRRGSRYRVDPPGL